MWFEVWVVLAAVMFDRFAPISLVVTALMLLAFKYSDRVVLLAGMLLGVVVDLEYAKALGLTSIVLMIFGGVVSILRIQFEWQRSVLVVIGAVVGEVVMRLWLGQALILHELLLQGVVMVLVLVVSMAWGRREGVYLK